MDGIFANNITTVSMKTVFNVTLFTINGNIFFIFS